MPHCTPHPDNVPGDFYVEDQCCLLCDVPVTEAPELFAYVDDPARSPYCFVKRQPETDEELRHMMAAMQYSEVQWIRYRGRDRGLQQTLVQLGQGPQCDHLPPDLEEAVTRRGMPWWRRLWPF